MMFRIKNIKSKILKGAATSHTKSHIKKKRERNKKLILTACLFAFDIISDSHAFVQAPSLFVLYTKCQVQLCIKMFTMMIRFTTAVQFKIYTWEDKDTIFLCVHLCVRCTSQAHF